MAPAGPVDRVDLAAAGRVERRALVDLFASLDADQLAVPSLCSAWSVGDVLAHLASPLALSKAEQARILARTRSFDGLTIGMVQAVRRLPFAEQLAALERSIDRPFVPPVSGLGAPLTDAVVHGEDVRIPLGLDRVDGAGDPLPADHLRAVLDFGTSWRAVPVFVPFRALSGRRLVATDLDWSWGPTSGTVVEAPARDLVRVVFGRANGGPG